MAFKPNKKTPQLIHKKTARKTPLKASCGLSYFRFLVWNAAFLYYSVPGTVWVKIARPDSCISRCNSRFAFSTADCSGLKRPSVI
ncbi:hypothetical protein SAMN02745216_02959 [Desulfatibacillum alkenivorans DSM 16219]|uniref:Uncharacterized protein n=1 Tax=Desulfatibacillum alkenivorans DSM 16219 TaxID=1121393 RepID=A0A1M6Q4D6_9BACT|nr:hypothetical protein SAMN02745216_02959 [Desulfatibacillum alkenivorans DSM 16219]